MTCGSREKEKQLLSALLLRRNTSHLLLQRVEERGGGVLKLERKYTFGDLCGHTCCCYMGWKKEWKLEGREGDLQKGVAWVAGVAQG